MLGMLQGLGFTPKQIGRVVTQRPALLVDGKALEERVELLRELCCSDKDLRNVATKWAGILVVEVGRARGVVRVLFEDDVGFTRANLRSIVRRAPWVLVYEGPAVDLV